MARVTFVKKAKQRYKTVPVIDPETGEQKVQTFTRRDGSLRTNKRGAVVTARVTREDRTQPLPNRKCGRCSKEIKPGDSYYWWANKLPGAGSGYKQIRCAEHPPTIQERTPGRAGQLMGLQSEWENELSACQSVEDLEAARDSIAGQIRDFGQEYVDSADNMESGFGHETYQSQELREKGEAIDSIADEVEQIDVEEFDEDEVDVEDYEGEDDPDYEAALEEARSAHLDKIRDEINDKMYEVES